ncbi:MAG: FAD/NAD(P)-binding protein [Deltaproteobacteria bacterium]|jgi:sulfhydrogenase subunit gamma (sulfur reductase)
MENVDYKTARLMEVLPETPDVNTYLFALEEEPEFAFSPGQFNMIGLPGVEEAPISMSSLAAPRSNLFSHTIRRVGNVTTLVAALRTGQKTMIRGPFGRGWPVEEMEGRDVLLIGGGIGLAPLKSLLLHCLADREKVRNLVLVYGARTQSNMIFQKDLMLWQKEQDVRTLYCVDRAEDRTESPLEIREALVPQCLEELGLEETNTVTCVCGPEVMMRFVARKLIREGYLSNRIYLGMERRMRCGMAHCGHCQIGAKFVCRDGPVFSYADIARFADVIL